MPLKQYLCAIRAAMAGVDEFVARRIYAGELGGKEVRADIAHVTGSRELLTALASSNQPASARIVSAAPGGS